MSFHLNPFYNKSIRRLRQMLHAIRMRDFTLQFALDKLRGEERLLAEEINEVVNEFREKTLKQQSQYQYFDTLLNTVGDCLIVTDDKGHIHWMNRTAINSLCGFRIYEIKDLASINNSLPQMMHGLRPGVKKILRLRVKNGNDTIEREHSITVTHFFDKGFYYKLYSLQNIHEVVQKSESEAQQQLVRVLTHEIMNSLTPIISLSDTLTEGMKDDTLSQDDITQALLAINRRSSGLLHFVENYRKLQHISAPQYTDITLGELISDLKQLFPAPYLHFYIEDTEQVLHIDRSQIEQLLINLLKNAEEAVKDNEDKNISITAKAETSQRIIIIRVKDNGCGIMPEVLDRIFIPFFSTKPGGSGIGLSVCRQIASLHGGTITVSSTPLEQTVFTLQLPL